MLGDGMPSVGPGRPGHRLIQTGNVAGEGTQDGRAYVPANADEPVEQAQQPSTSKGGSILRPPGLTGALSGHPKGGAFPSVLVVYNAGGDARGLR